MNNNQHPSATFKWHGRLCFLSSLAVAFLLGTASGPPPFVVSAAVSESKTMPPESSGGIGGRRSFRQLLLGQLEVADNKKSGETSGVVEGGHGPPGERTNALIDMMEDVYDVVQGVGPEGASKLDGGIKREDMNGASSTDLRDELVHEVKEEALDDGINKLASLLNFLSGNSNSNSNNNNNSNKNNNKKDKNEVVLAGEVVHDVAEGNTSSLSNDDEDKKHTTKNNPCDSVGLAVYLIALGLSVYTVTSSSTSDKKRTKTRKTKAPPKNHALAFSFRSLLVFGTVALVAVSLASKASGQQAIRISTGKGDVKAGVFDSMTELKQASDGLLRGSASTGDAAGAAKSFLHSLRGIQGHLQDNGDYESRAADTIKATVGGEDIMDDAQEGPFAIVTSKGQSKDLSKDIHQSTPQCVLKLHENLSHLKNWNEAAAFCHDQGGQGSRLAKFEEYCPSGLNQPPVFGTKGGDQWAAAFSEDEGNIWVQVGTWPGDGKGQTCILHNDISAGVGPAWGTDDTKNAYESNYAYCYECHEEPGYKAEYCYRESYVRGGGIELPSEDCSNGKEGIGLLCYPKCDPGYSRWGFDCHQDCPGGWPWTNRGLLCERVHQYGRGLGYPWLFGDPAFQNTGQIARCEADVGAGKCESCGALVFPKCADGWDVGEYNAGLLPCQHCKYRHNPDEPINCERHGMLPSIWEGSTHCLKKIDLGSPLFKDCANGQGEFSLGLCYTEPCKEGYEGAGPTCWVKPPEGYERCGMGAAKVDPTKQDVCEEVTFGQVTSVVKVALDVAQLAADVMTGGDAYIRELFKRLLDKFGLLMGEFGAKGELWSAYEKAKGVYEKAHGWIEVFSADDLSRMHAPDTIVSDIDHQMEPDPNKVTPQDILRVTAQILAVIDVTGLAEVAASYSWPMCNQIRDNPVAA